MYYTRAPLRLGLLGGGSDLFTYSDEHSGRVLNVSLNLYAHCFIEKIEDEENNVFIKCFDNNNKLIKDNVLVEACVSYFREKTSIFSSLKIKTHVDLPAGTGLGSSSTLCVAVLRCLFFAFNKKINNKEIADMAVEVERFELGWMGGIQDQYSAALGGFRDIFISQNRNVFVKELKFSQQTQFELQSSIMLYNTGRSRKSMSIIKDQIKNFSIDNDKIEAMKWSTNKIDEAIDFLSFNKVSKFLDIYASSWSKKKKFSNEITNRDIDNLSKLVLNSGGLGIKISGAGGGGVAAIIASPEKHNQIKHTINQQSPFHNGEFINYSFSQSGVMSFKIK